MSLQSQYDQQTYGFTPGCIPAFNLNVPYGGLQGPPLIVPSDQPVFSSYTGNLIGIGPIPNNIRTDAPKGCYGHGQNFHVIERTSNNEWMAHKR